MTSKSEQIEENKQKNSKTQYELFLTDKKIYILKISNNLNSIY